MQTELLPDDASLFEKRDCGHLPCPPWLTDGDAAPQGVALAPQDEPELDPPHHIHDLWAVLGLGEA